MIPFQVAGSSVTGVPSPAVSPVVPHPTLARLGTSARAVTLSTSAPTGASVTMPTTVKKVEAHDAAHGPPAVIGPG